MGSSITRRSFNKARALMEGVKCRSVRQRQEVSQRASLHDPHATRRIGHVASAKEPEQERINPIAEATNGGHLRAGAESRSQHDVRALIYRRKAQSSEEDRVTRAIGVEESQQIAPTYPPAFFDRGPVTTILDEDDHPYFTEASGDLHGSIGGTIAHHDNLDVIQAGHSGNLLAGLQASRDGCADRALLVQCRDDDGQAIHAD